MDFASILSKEYADAMMKAGTPEKLDLNPIGTGPFQLQQYQKIPVSATKRLMATGAPNRRSIRWFSLLPLTLPCVTRNCRRMNAVMPYPNPADIARMKQDKSINLMEMPGLNVGYLSYNVQKKPLDDVKVRRSDLRGEQRRDHQSGLSGRGRISENLIPPTMWGYNDDVQDYTYDPEKRKPC